jgi:hypothetical protein
MGGFIDFEIGPLEKGQGFLKNNLSQPCWLEDERSPGLGNPIGIQVSKA